MKARNYEERDNGVKWNLIHDSKNAQILEAV